MSTQQQTFLDLPGEALDAAIAKIRGYALRHANWAKFVSEVASLAMACRGGTVILCAAPSGIVADELIVDLDGELERRYKQQLSRPFEGLRIVHTPSPLRRRRNVGALLEAYESPEYSAAYHRHPPRFQLEAQPQHAPTQFQKVSSLLKLQAGQFCLFKNVHLLQSADETVSDVADALMTVVDLAERSKRNHILLGDTQVLLKWMRNPDIARSVSMCRLAPYDLCDAIDAAQFKAIATLYDDFIPWEQPASLSDHLKEINAHVYGGVHRLRKWIVHALCLGKAHKHSRLKWEVFMEAAPLPSEASTAAAELNLSRWFDRKLEPKEEEDRSIGGGKPKGHRPVGIRAPDRNSEAA